MATFTPDKTDSDAVRMTPTKDGAGHVVSVLPTDQSVTIEVLAATGWVPVVTHSRPTGGFFAVVLEPDESKILVR